MRRKLTLPHWVVGHISKVVKGEGMPRPKQLTREQLLQGLREMMEAAEARSKARNAASRAARKRKTLHEEVRVAERNLQAFCEGRQAAEKQRGKVKRGRKVGQEPSEGDFEALEAALVAFLHRESRGQPKRGPRKDTDADIDALAAKLEASVRRRIEDAEPSKRRRGEPSDAEFFEPPVAKLGASLQPEQDSQQT